MSIISLIITYILILTKAWLNIFINTITNLKIIWITYPVYITWFSMEFLVEKKGIHYGHAVANSIIFSWVSVDWLRELYETNQLHNFDKLFIASIFLILSAIILFSAFKRWEAAKIFGKTGFFAYFQIMLTPFMYDIVPFTLINIIALIVFFPIVYYLFFILDIYLPEIIEEEEEKIKEEEEENFAEENLQYSNYQYYNYQYPYYNYPYYTNYYYRRYY